MTVIRCSSSDRAHACALSTTPIDNPYNPDSQPARDGTACHEVCETVVAGPFNAPALLDKLVADLSSKYGTSQGDLRMAHGYAAQAWEEVKQWFPIPATEHPLAGPVTRGTSDVVSIDGGSILDWKSGWGRVEHPYQLMAYADAFRETHGMPEQGFVLGVEVWLKHREYRVHKFTAAKLDRFREHIAKQIVRDSATPGAHCTFCPRQLQCEARDQYIRSTATALVAQTGEVDALVIGNMHDHAKALKSALARYDAVVKAHVAEHGFLPLPNGKQLVDAGREVTEIQTEEAWPVLAKWFESSELAQAVKVSKTKLMDAAKAQAPKGEKQKRAAGLMADLAEAGALKKKTQSRLAIVDNTEVGNGS